MALAVAMPQSPHGSLSWTSHPARRRPRDVALVVAVVFVTAGAALEFAESALLAGLAAAVLLVAVAPFLLPTRYTLTDEEIVVERAFGRRSRRFADLRRVVIGRDAALVTPFARPTWMDRYRGMIVQFDGADRDAVVRALEAKLGAKR